MPTEQAHAVVHHLLQVQTRQDLTEAQERFLEVLVKELVHRNAAVGWQQRCRCRVCAPARAAGP